MDCFQFQWCDTDCILSIYHNELDEFLFISAFDIVGRLTTVCCHWQSIIILITLSYPFHSIWLIIWFSIFKIFKMHAVRSTSIIRSINARPLTKKMYKCQHVHYAVSRCQHRAVYRLTWPLVSIWIWCANRIKRKSSPTNVRLKDARKRS